MRLQKLNSRQIQTDYPLTDYVNKTIALLFTNRHHASNNNKIQINDTILNFSTSHKFLGVTIDNKFKFNEHIRFICKKVSKSVGILGRLRNIVPCEVMIL